MDDDDFKAHTCRLKSCLSAMGTTEILYETHRVATCRCGVGYTDAFKDFPTPGSIASLDIVVIRFRSRIWYWRNEKAYHCRLLLFCVSWSTQTHTWCSVIVEPLCVAWRPSLGCLAALFRLRVKMWQVDMAITRLPRSRMTSPAKCSELRSLSWSQSIARGL